MRYRTGAMPIADEMVVACHNLTDLREAEKTMREFARRLYALAQTSTERLERARDYIEDTMSTQWVGGGAQGNLMCARDEIDALLNEAIVKAEGR